MCYYNWSKDLSSELRLQEKFFVIRETEISYFHEKTGLYIDFTTNRGRKPLKARNYYFTKWFAKSNYPHFFQKLSSFVNKNKSALLENFVVENGL